MCIDLVNVNDEGFESREAKRYGVGWQLGPTLSGLKGTADGIP